MIQAGFQMISIWALAFLHNFGFMKEPACKHYNHVSGCIILVTLITATCGAAVGPDAASKGDCYRKSCMDKEYDILKATCCENQLYLGEGLSCCGGQAFNPEEATCCKVEDGRNTTAVTEGLSEKVSACCGLKAYNHLNEMCCQSTVVVKPAPKAECCGTGAYDENTQLCCGPINSKKILTKKNSSHLCCGHDQFDTKTQCCSAKTLQIKLISSSVCRQESAHCGTKAYNIFHELCCQSTVVTKPTPNAKCCGKQTFDEGTQLCCGPISSKKILTKKSSSHLCCGHDQFDTKTQDCSATLEIQSISSSGCQKESGVQRQNPAPQPTCAEPETSLCGLSCYNPSHLSCCERNLGKSKECCTTAELLSLAHRGLLCTNNTLCKDRGDGEECSGISIPYNPAKGTVCRSQLHGSTGQHCCGTGVYWPRTEICCDGHRHHREDNTHCCGVKAYNTEDTRMKCCAGTLYNLTSGHEAQCCGSTLLTPPNVCCSSEDMEVLYAAKAGFGCCGHLYYNASLWLCCAGRLSPVHQPRQHQSKIIKESGLLSVNNLNEAHLCEEMQVGTVESVSPHSVVFSSVLKINGRNATVTLLASPHILETPDHCSFPKLIHGKTYFFDKVNVFTDFNHDSILKSLHFITSKCYRPVTTTS